MRARVIFVIEMTERERNVFYASRAWERKRLEILRRDHYECQECRRRIEEARQSGVSLPPRERKIRRAVQVHHIKTLKDHPELRLDSDNLISVCHECHDRLHGRVIDRLRPKKDKKPVTEERW